MENTDTRERNIPLAILFSIITCSIYAWYWAFCILDDTYNLLDEDGDPFVDLLLTFFTCGIYGFFLWYKVGTELTTYRERNNMTYRDNATLFLILSIMGFVSSFFFGIGSIFKLILFSIAQSEINYFLSEYNKNKNAPKTTSNAVAPTYSLDTNQTATANTTSINKVSLGKNIATTTISENTVTSNEPSTEVLPTVNDVDNENV